MIRLNIHEAKTNLSRYLEQVESGERIVLCRRNVPIAEIRRLPAPQSTVRRLGFARERYPNFDFTLPPSFFEPVDDELVLLFDGRGT